jgi:translin
MNLGTILRKIDGELERRERIKNELYNSMRQATRLSKQAIFLTHRRQFDRANELLGEAAKLFSMLEDGNSRHREFAHVNVVYAAFEEYAEAQILLSLLQEDKFVAPEEIHVPYTSYLLGLADVVGELRRAALDSLRREEIEIAEKHLERMELIYNKSISMDAAMHFVSELRRKTDVSRRIIEATRGDVTNEVCRNSLERSIKKLQTSITTE